MAGRIGVIAALPRELRAVVGRAEPAAALVGQGVYLYMMERATLVAAGMGSGRVSLAVEAALADGDVVELISVGLAGGCSADAVPGTVMEAGVVVEPRTGERFRTGLGAERPVLVTSEAIASVGEKVHLAAAYGASLVDMEAATVARLAAAHGLRFRAIKGVSDGHDFELASLGRFTGKHGSFRTGAFALHTAFRPRTWAAAGKLGRNSNRALTALAAQLVDLIGS